MSNDQQVTRTGRGVPTTPAQRQKQRRWFGIKPEFVIAASVVIAVAIMSTAALLTGSSGQPAGDPSPSRGLSAEVQAECLAIKHEYTLWKKTDPDFNLLRVSDARIVADMRMDSLSEAGDSFLKAATGYNDQPSRALALSISQHNYDLAVINLELTAANQITTENYDKARASRQAIEKNYESFLALTCAGSH